MTAYADEIWESCVREARGLNFIAPDAAPRPASWIIQDVVEARDRYLRKLAASTGAKLTNDQKEALGNVFELYPEADL